MDSVYPKTCDKDQELKDGQCVPKTCDKDQELKDGQCVPKTCDKDQELKDGQCINGPLFTDSPSDPKVPPNTIISFASKSYSANSTVTFTYTLGSDFVYPIGYSWGSYLSQDQTCTFPQRGHCG